MKDINQERLGSTLDDLLESEDELMEVTAIAHKQVIDRAASALGMALDISLVEKEGTL